MYLYYILFYIYTYNNHKIRATDTIKELNTKNSHTIVTGKLQNSFDLTPSNVLCYARRKVFHLWFVVTSHTHTFHALLYLASSGFAKWYNTFIITMLAPVMLLLLHLCYKKITWIHIFLRIGASKRWRYNERRWKKSEIWHKPFLLKQSLHLRYVLVAMICICLLVCVQIAIFRMRWYCR